MKRPRRAAIIKLLFIAVLLGIVIIALSRRGANEHLSYLGRPIDYWFAQLPITTLVSSNMIINIRAATIMGSQYGNTSAVEQTFAAWVKFGTNAIPFLLQKLENTDSPVEMKATYLAWKIGAKPSLFRNAEVERGQALTALIHLKDLPTGAERKLVTLTSNAPSAIAACARHVLLAPRGGWPEVYP